MKIRASKWAMVLAVLGIMIGSLSTQANADEKKGDKASATGNWSWTFDNQNGDKIEISAKLTQKDEKLTGTVKTPDGKDVEIADGKVKDGDISFTVNHEHDGMKITAKFSGKLTKDEIKGKTAVTVGTEDHNFDWTAKREKKDK